MASTASPASSASRTQVVGSAAGSGIGSVVGSDDNSIPCGSAVGCEDIGPLLISGGPGDPTSTPAVVIDSLTSRDCPKAGRGNELVQAEPLSRRRATWACDESIGVQSAPTDIGIDSSASEDGLDGCG